MDPRKSTRSSGDLLSLSGRADILAVDEREDGGGMEAAKRADELSPEDIEAVQAVTFLAATGRG